MNHSFDEWMKTSKDLIKQIFGEELYSKLEKTKLKPINYTGLDISCSELLATNLSIKELLNRNGISYLKRNNQTALDLFLTIVFRFGYQQCVDCEVKKYEIIMDLLNNLGA